MVCLFTACSAIKIGYNNAPELAYWWLDGYADFSEVQTLKAREELARLHQWHRTTELPRLAELLQKMENTGVKESFSEIIKKMPSKPIVNNFFHNTKNNKFEETAQSFGFTQPSFSNGAAYGDLDNDGDLDLVVNNVNMPSFVYQNHSEKKEIKNHYIKVNLQGEGKNVFAIGTKVDVYANNMVLTRSVNPSRGFQSSTEYTLTIGLGQTVKIDSVKITWADRRVSIIKNPAIDKLHSFSIKEAKKDVGNSNALPQNSLFEPTTISLEKHQEDDYDDYYQEKNLPVLLSKEGPKSAIGDVNGDGKEDLFICGAKGQAGVLYLQTGSGFKKTNQEGLNQLAYFEDTSAQFFDADKDGDLDLYVGSGGNEFPSGQRELMDRLYMNDGKGNFTINGRGIPPNTTNTSVIAPYDYDNDGDIDLFVGSRNQSQQYGLNPASFIYENNGVGEFRDVSQSMNVELAQLGMIRDAYWEDLNGDKRKELIVVGDWMAPTVFSLQGKTLVKMETNLEKYTGFWGALKVTDIDNDGDNDLILGNIGENFNLNASEESPLKIWVKDFDSNGSIDKILTKTIDGKDSPVFLKREFAEQFPFLKKQILKHSDYAQKSLPDLFPSNVLNDVLVKTVTFRKSVVALNDGKGKFTLIDLPENVQTSCINAITCYDINKDGLKDIILGGNYTGFVPQLGAIDASRGDVLLNKGKGKFKVLSSQESGFKMNGELRQISPIIIQGKQNFIALLNNDFPKIFRLK